MVKKYTIKFREVTDPIIEYVTKFGGQPVWLTEPQWPLSRSTGEPMRFICQIALDTELFGPLAGRMVYLFMTEGEEYANQRTWEPDGGENALIMQPGSYTLPTQPLLTGPTIQKWVDAPSEQGRYVDCEYAVELVPGEDPDIIEDIVVRAQEPGYDESLPDPLDEDKIGGTPAFLQGPEYPEGGPWKLVLQLNEPYESFSVNFGDAGIGYAFISEDGNTGKFLWQCA